MTTHWTWERAAAVGLGGVAGASCRWLAISATTPGRFPWTTFVLNIFGSFLLGVFMAVDPGFKRTRIVLHDFGAIGFCGGLTTFSSFAVEVVRLTDDGWSAMAITYTVLSVIGALIAVAAGAELFRRVQAIRLPLEESP